jgi:hypothetical protein
VRKRKLKQVTPDSDTDQEEDKENIHPNIAKSALISPSAPRRATDAYTCTVEQKGKRLVLRMRRVKEENGLHEKRRDGYVMM